MTEWPIKVAPLKDGAPRVEPPREAPPKEALPREAPEENVACAAGLDAVP